MNGGYKAKFFRNLFKLQPKRSLLVLDQDNGVLDQVETLRAKRQKKPKHTTETRAYVFALDVNEQQSATLHAVREACWELRNKLTEERRANRALVHEAKAKLGQVASAAEVGPLVTYLTRAEQYKSVAACAASEQCYGQIHSQVL